MQLRHVRGVPGALMDLISDIAGAPLIPDPVGYSNCHAPLPGIKVANHLNGTAEYALLKSDRKAPMKKEACRAEIELTLSKAPAAFAGAEAPEPTIRFNFSRWTERGGAGSAFQNKTQTHSTF